MAKVLKYSKTTIEKIDIKGILDEEAKTITYEEKDGDSVIEKTIEVQTLFNQFASNKISLTISSKSDEDLDLIIDKTDEDEDDEEYV